MGEQTYGDSSLSKRSFAFLFDMMLLAGVDLLILNLTKNLYGFTGPVLFLLKDMLGRSPGKFLAGLKVVKKTGQEITVFKSIVRNIPLCFIASVTLVHHLWIFLFLLIAILEYLFLRTSQGRLGDRLAKTRVIDLNPKRQNWLFVLGLIPLLLLWVGLKGYTLLSYHAITRVGD